MTMLSPRHLTVLALILAATCRRTPQESPEQVFARYREAANRHDLPRVRGMLAEEAVWYLGTDTLVGPEAILRPHEFDQGARTVLEVEDVTVFGDTVSFDLIERNDVLTALGVPALHHRGRMVITDGLIRRIGSREPPLELAAFRDSVLAFQQWLRINDPAGYERLWPGGKFSYSRSVGEEMPKLVSNWKRSRR